MGLNKEVRDFFTNKINSVINKKIKAAKSVVNEDELMALAIATVTNDGGFTKEYTEYFELKKIKDDADARMSAIRDTISRRAFYVNWELNQVADRAKSDVMPKLIKAHYPEVSAEIERLEKAKEDVYGAVLLATSEPKLIEALNRVLTKYGGDLQEVLDIIN